MTWAQEFWTYALVLGCCQLWVAARFALYLRKNSSSGSGAYSPPVTLIVPCKGAGTGFIENIRSMLRQRYRGALEILFVVPAESDPAFAALREILSREDAKNARVLVSNLIPEKCSGKATDLIFALEHVSPQCELLAFADSDIRVREDWLSELAAALAVPQTTVSTSVMLYIAASKSFWTWMRMVNLAACIPYSYLSGWVVGQSFVIRRKDFERLGIRDVWSLSLLEDMPVTARVRTSGGKVRYVPQATPISTEDCDRAGYFGLFNKWMICVRVYAPVVWSLTFIATSFHLWVAFWCLYPRFHPQILTALLVGDAVYLGLVFSVLQRFLPDRFEEINPSLRPVALWAALSAPLVWLFSAVQLARSLTTRDVRWGSVVYRLYGPQKVEVLR